MYYAWILFLLLLFGVSAFFVFSLLRFVEHEKKKRGKEQSLWAVPFFRFSEEEEKEWGTLPQRFKHSVHCTPKRLYIYIRIYLYRERERVDRRRIEAHERKGGKMSLTEAQFEANLKAIKSFNRAAQDFEKANHKAMLAIQQVASAVHAMALSLRGMCAGPDFGESCCQYVDSMEARLCAFRDGTAFSNYNTAFHSDVTEAFKEIEKRSTNVERDGVERRDARERLIRYTNARNYKPEKVATATDALNSKSEAFTRSYTTFVELTSRDLPLVARSMMRLTANYTSELTTALQEAGQLTQTPRITRNHRAASAEPTNSLISAATSVVAPSTVPAAAPLLRSNTDHSQTLPRIQNGSQFPMALPAMQPPPLYGSDYLEQLRRADTAVPGVPLEQVTPPFAGGSQSASPPPHPQSVPNPRNANSQSQAPADGSLFDRPPKTLD